MESNVRIEGQGNLTKAQKGAGAQGNNRVTSKGREYKATTGEQGNNRRTRQQQENKATKGEQGDNRRTRQQQD